MDILRSAWKAVAAFAAVFIAQLLENLVSTDGSVVLPQTVAEWTTVVGTALVGAVLVYVLPNRYTKPQVESHLEKLPPEDQKDIMRNKHEQHPNWTP